MGKTKQASAKTLATIADDCDAVLAFLQAFTVKSPQVTLAPLSLCADKRARVWFRRWEETNLTTSPKPVPQDHTGLTVVLIDVANSLQTAEALHLIAATHHEEEKETKGWYCIPPTAQCVILAASVTNGTSIMTLPPPTLHCFLNGSNVTALQDNCDLTYAGNNLYFITSFCQDLFQGHILAIPDPDAMI